MSLFIVWWETVLALEVPPDALSRVSSFDWMGSLGPAPVGLLFAPPLRAVVQPNSGTPLSGVDASA